MLVAPNDKLLHGKRMKRCLHQWGKMLIDNYKGFPPCLQDPLVPFDMVPYNDQDLFEQPVYDPECKTIMFGWQMIKGKKGANEEEKGFNKDE